MDLLKSRAVALIAFATMSSAISYSITLFYGPLLFTFGRNNSAVQSGFTAILPFTGPYIFSPRYSPARLCRNFVVYAPLYIIGGLLIVIGAGVQTTITTSTSRFQNLKVQQLLIGRSWSHFTLSTEHLTASRARQ